mmetsp:Transcript_83363/g.248669  ORF Transcript_83363/g.248669 Transcript_83363/m.248669 type:complete len:306 (+) Transcript_83363:1202-2119(+)
MALVQRDAQALGLLVEVPLCLLVQLPDAQGLSQLLPHSEEVFGQLAQRLDGAFELLEAGETLAEATVGLQVRKMQARNELYQLLAARGLALRPDVPELHLVIALLQVFLHLSKDVPQVCFLELAVLGVVRDVGATQDVLRELLRRLGGALHGVEGVLAGAVEVRAEARLCDAGHENGARVHGQSGELALVLEHLGLPAQHRPVAGRPLEAAAGVVAAENGQGQPDVLQLFVIADGVGGDAARGAGRQAAEVPHCAVQDQQPQAPPHRRWICVGRDGHVEAGDRTAAYGVDDDGRGRGTRNLIQGL